jgi:general secretion pathway protein K
METGKWKHENGNPLSLSAASIFHFRISSFLFPESRTLNPAAGVALLAVMSAVSVMLLVALAFAGSVQIETRTAIYRREATQAYALAAGGVQAAILEIAYPPPNDQRNESPLWVEGQRLLRVPYQGGQAVVEIVNETGKLDLNAAGPEQLTRLFEARGMEKTAAAALAAAIENWRTPASDSRESRALEDYYHDAGIHPAHAHFSSLEEVLLVRGMSRDVFYGTAELTSQQRIERRYAVAQDLTIYSQTSHVNVNYASEAALLSVPGMDESLTGPLLEQRSLKPFKSLNDLEQRLATSVPLDAVPFLTTDTCKIYTIVAVGAVKGSPVRRSVKAVVQVAPQQGPARHRIIGWYDDVTE